MRLKHKLPEVQFESGVLQSIRRHARSSMEAEICGVLIGSLADGQVVIDGCIPGEHAAQGGAHVTFTQETWEHIYQVKDRDFPDRSIVGWYHSHPGFGVFLSEYDQFIHENFFSAPHQIAWVFDPHSDEEGCFAWHARKLRRLKRFWVANQRADEPEEPRPEPEPSVPRADHPEKRLSWWAGLSSLWHRARGEAALANRAQTSETSMVEKPVAANSASEESSSPKKT